MTNTKYIKIQIIIAILLLSPEYSAAEFVDKIKQSGIKFVHVNGMQGKYYMPEIIGSGVAVLDYDNDGDMDVYLVQSGYLLDSPKPYSDRLYRNDTKKKDTPVFVDVTKQAKISALGYGMGAAAGDLNNDGFTDIFVANYGENQVLMNNGDGTFTSSKIAMKNKEKKWSVSASIADQDSDGYLDIYVVNYVNFPLIKYIKQCKAYDGSPDYCSPQGYSYDSDDLFKNNKDGTFSNISFKAGLGQKEGPGLGVVAADFNGDNRIDYYVANDGVENHLWMNKGGDEYIEYALGSGVAVNMNGEPEASMGVDAADYDNDGDIDLFMTHLNRQTNTLYVNNGKGWFTDLTVRMKLGSSSFTSTGFGTLWFDYDNDGELDLFSANGAVAKIKNQITDPYPFKQPNQLWRNVGNGKYLEVSKNQGKGFLRNSVSRGAAFADFDNDGDLDILVTNNNDVPMMLINESKAGNNWIGIKALNKKLNRVDLGAQITIEQTGKKRSRRVKTDGGYASSHDDRVIIGLGKNNANLQATIKWSDGSENTYKNLSINRYHELISK